MDHAVTKLYDGLVKSFVDSKKLESYVDPKTFVVPEYFEDALKE